MRRSGREVLERLPEVRGRVRLVLLLGFLALLRGFFLRFRRLDSLRVGAAGLLAQDRPRVVQLHGPLATFHAHAAMGAILRVEVLLVPREEDFAVTVRAMEGPRLPHDPFREDGDSAVAELRGHPSQTKARAVMKLPTRAAGWRPAHNVKWSGFHGAVIDARTPVATLPRSRGRHLPPRGGLVDPGDLRPGRRRGARGPDARRDDWLERPREDPAHRVGAPDVPRRHRDGGHEDPDARDVRVCPLA